MSEQTPHPLIPPEIDAEMTPAVRAFVHALIHGFQEQIAVLQNQIVVLNSRIVELESQVKKLTPQNSSVPPSTIHPHAKPISNKPKSQRKRGGQPGHKRHQRVLIPTEECNESIPLIPTNCRRCHCTLVGCDPMPLRHQVFELPKIVPIVTEYQRHRLNCPKCGITTCAQLPEGVPEGQFGPRLIAFNALLMGRFRQSKRLASEFIKDLLNLPCSPSMVVKMQTIASNALAAPHEELREALAVQENVHMDETPTKQANSKAWLWTAVGLNFAVYSVFPTRAATAITAMLGECYQGIINCDRAKMYFIAERLQWCWAHLIRDVQRMIDSKVSCRVALGTSLMEQIQEMFRCWHRYKASEITWNDFQQAMLPISKSIHGSLYSGSVSQDSKLRNQCKSLYKHRANLWRFVASKGIEPTNNTAERALRGAVIYRKLSFGTQSEPGSRFVERIFSIVQTCRMQNRNAYEYLVEAVEAKLSNKNPPKLLTNP